MSRSKEERRVGGPPEVVSLEADRGYSLETCCFQGAAGDEVMADAYLASRPGPVVVGAHATGGSRRSQYLRGPAKAWAMRGLSLIAADAPLHGDRASAEPLPDILLVDPVLLQRWLGDRRRLVDAIGARLGPEVRIGLVGFSLGALYGVHLLAAEPRLEAAVLAIAGSTRRLAAGLPAAEESGTRAALEAADPVLAAARVTPRPVLMINADRDEVFSRTAAFELFDALPPPKEIVFLSGTHASWPSPGRWFRLMGDFLREALDG